MKQYKNKSIKVTEVIGSWADIGKGIMGGVHIAGGTILKIFGAGGAASALEKIEVNADILPEWSQSDEHPEVQAKKDKIIADKASADKEVADIALKKFRLEQEADRVKKDNIIKADIAANDQRTKKEVVDNNKELNDFKIHIVNNANVVIVLYTDASKNSMLKDIYSVHILGGTRVSKIIVSGNKITKLPFDFGYIDPKAIKLSLKNGSDIIADNVKSVLFVGGTEKTTTVSKYINMYKRSVGMSTENVSVIGDILNDIMTADDPDSFTQDYGYSEMEDPASQSDYASTSDSGTLTQAWVLGCDVLGASGMGGAGRKNNKKPPVNDQRQEGKAKRERMFRVVKKANRIKPLKTFGYEHVKGPKHELTVLKVLRPPRGGHKYSIINAHEVVKEINKVSKNLKSAIAKSKIVKVIGAIENSITDANAKALIKKANDLEMRAKRLNKLAVDHEIYVRKLKAGSKSSIVGGDYDGDYDGDELIGEALYDIFYDDIIGKETDGEEEAEYSPDEILHDTVLPGASEDDLEYDEGSVPEDAVYFKNNRDFPTWGLASYQTIAKRKEDGYYWTNNRNLTPLVSVKPILGWTPKDIPVTLNKDADSWKGLATRYFKAPAGYSLEYSKAFDPNTTYHVFALTIEFLSTLVTCVIKGAGWMEINTANRDKGEEGLFVEQPVSGITVSNPGSKFGPLVGNWTVEPGSDAEWVKGLRFNYSNKKWWWPWEQAPAWARRPYEVAEAKKKKLDAAVKAAAAEVIRLQAEADAALEAKEAADLIKRNEKEDAENQRRRDKEEADAASAQRIADAAAVTAAALDAKREEDRIKREEDRIKREEDRRDREKERYGSGEYGPPPYGGYGPPYGGPPPYDGYGPPYGDGGFDPYGGYGPPYGDGGFDPYGGGEGFASAEQGMDYYNQMFGQSEQGGSDESKLDTDQSGDVYADDLLSDIED